MILYLLKLLDEFPDTVGFARIVQALQATEWPNLQMKGNYFAKKSNRILDSGI